MATPASVSNQDGILKTLYPDMVIDPLTYEGHPFLAMVPKREDFYGKNYEIPVHYEDVIGSISTFTNAQTDGAASLRDSFTLTRVKDYTVARINNEALEAARSKSGAFVELVKAEIDSAFRRMANGLSRQLYRGGNGVLGQASIATTVTKTKSITLKTSDDIVNFSKGMKLDFAYAAGGSGRGTKVQKKVSQVDRNNGKVVLTASVSLTTKSTATGKIGTADYFHQLGNRGTTLRIKGLAAWMLTAAPTSKATFFGVTRAADSRLYGNYINGAALTLQEALVKGAARAGREGGKVNKAFMSFSKWEELVLELGIKKEYVDSKVAGVAFEGVKVYGPTGVIECYADRDCPSNRIFLLDMSSWKLCSLGKAPHILNSDGAKMQRLYNADGVEFRVGFYGQLGCSAPGHNVMIAV